MGDGTSIQWTDATWNPIRGCSRVSEGCRHCYAETVAARFSGPGLAYEGLTRRRSNGEAQWTGEVRVIESHMLDPLRWRRPRRIFVNSMSDLFHENVSDDTIAEIFGIVALAPQHTFQVLTKRPARMRDWLASFGLGDALASAALAFARLGEPETRFTELSRHLREHDHQWPLPNLWLGVSVEDQAAAHERIPLLLQSSAALRFLSCEPLLGPLQIAEYLPNPLWNHLTSWKQPEIDWVIIGGESGAGARPFDVRWARQIIEQCRVGKVDVFVKQLGAKPYDSVLAWKMVDRRFEPSQEQAYQLSRFAFANDPRHAGDPSEWPADLRVREFPRAAAA